MIAPLLHLANISKRFPGVRALDGVDLSIGAGEIHCLVGENGSGKSTLIKIVAGVERPDTGSKMEMDGKPLRRWDSSRAIGHGIEVIYQDLSLFPNLTVAENIGLGQLVEEKATWMRWGRVRRITEQALGRIEAEINVDDMVGSLSLADQQLVAIARALTSSVRLLIMDEPTASLTRREIDALFAVVKGLQTKGISTLFVSHKLDEVFEIAEQITVLRDGKKVGTFPRADLTAGELTRLMTGREPDATPYARERVDEQPLLEVEGLSKAGQFHDVSLNLLPGEIVGLAGLLGAGRTELALSLFGMSPPDAGEVRLNGMRQDIRSAQDAIRLGIGLIPENRSAQGLVMPHSVGRNAILTVIEQLRGRLGLLSPRRQRMEMTEAVRGLAIRAPSLDAPAETLSGGNQQRLVLAKWLAAEPRILILDGPTVGIDVAAKAAIHEIIRGLARDGMGILMICDEVRELMENCNRILLMEKGRIATEWDTRDVSETEIATRLFGSCGKGR